MLERRVVEIKTRADLPLELQGKRVTIEELGKSVLKNNGPGDYSVTVSPGIVEPRCASDSAYTSEGGHRPYTRP